MQKPPTTSESTTAQTATSAAYTPSPDSTNPQIVPKSKKQGQSRRRNKSNGSESKQSPATELSNIDQEHSDGEDENICFICADTVKFYAIGECNHLTCFRCNLRLRALFKSKACPYCKTELDTIIYASNPDTPFEELSKCSLPYLDKGLNIKFDCKEAYDVTMHTLQFNCPHRKCSYVDNNGWKSLKEHARNEHSQQFCDLCLKNKKSFAHEHKLFTKSQLRAHYSRGDGIGFTGHPECEFCRTSFYDNDQLFDHCRKKHEQCFICVRNNTGRQVYYANYSTLEGHFNSVHFPCKHATCLERKFVVFENEIDLQGHELAEHGGAIVGQRARREAKQISLNFQYAAPRSGASSGGANNGGSSNNNRGKQRNSSQQQPSTMTVNEPDIAGVSIAGRRRPTGFGRAASSDPHHPDAIHRSNFAVSESASASGPPTPEPELESLWPTLGSGPDSISSGSRPVSTTASPLRAHAPAGFGHLSSNLSPGTEAAGSADAIDDTISLHQELLQRVSAYLSHREQPVSRFRQLTTHYKDSQLSADDYVQNCWLLFLTVPGKNAKEMIQKTMRSVASLLPDPVLKDSLLKALNEHRIKQQQFPALTPLTSIGPSDSASGNQARVLVIKKPSDSGTRKSGTSSGNASTWATPSPSSQSATAKSRVTGQQQHAHGFSYTSLTPSSALSPAAFPLLGANSKSSSSLNSMVSQMKIEPRQPGNTANNNNSNHSSYSAKFTKGTSAKPGYTAPVLQTNNSDFPGLPPPSKRKVTIPPINSNATSAWTSGTPDSHTGAGGSSKKPETGKSRNAKGKQVLFHCG